MDGQCNEFMDFRYPYIYLLSFSKYFIAKLPDKIKFLPVFFFHYCVHANILNIPTISLKITSKELLTFILCLLGKMVYHKVI